MKIIDFLSLHSFDITLHLRREMRQILLRAKTITLSSFLSICRLISCHSKSWTILSNSMTFCLLISCKNGLIIIFNSST